MVSYSGAQDPELSG